MIVQRQSSSGRSPVSFHGRSYEDGIFRSQPSSTPCPWSPCCLGLQGWGSRGSWCGPRSTSPRDRRLYVGYVSFIERQFFRGWEEGSTFDTVIQVLLEL